MTDPFRNNWKAVSRAPDEAFQSAPFMEVERRSTSWSLPQPWHSIVRVENKSTGQVVERAFKTEAAARRFVETADSNGWHHTYYNEEVMHSTHSFSVEEA
jgi:hypothetical protein